MRVILIQAAVAIGVVTLIGCSKDIHPERRYGPPAEENGKYQVEIHHPQSVGALDTDIHDINGLPVGVSCTTCHGDRKDGTFVDADIPENFHGGLKLEHGSINCNSCHAADDRTRLHLADGTKLEFHDAMKLCAQCHGVQYRDYENGSHGGMAGYWDLKRGPRQRNSCLDCHSPHSPGYSKVTPVHPPKDRFLEWIQHQEKQNGEAEH
jgi:hypothetical protein